MPASCASVCGKRHLGFMVAVFVELSRRGGKFSLIIGSVLSNSSTFNRAVEEARDDATPDQYRRAKCA